MWWSEGNTTPEGVVIEDLFTSFGIHQLICEPTNLETNKNPSCIDLVVTDQPNLVLDSGTRPSLDYFCHHQIIHCKVNFRIPPPPAYESKVWIFNRANVNSIKKSMTNFPWLQHLSLNRDPNWQVKTFTDTILNIMANFVPHETKNIMPRDSPCITKQLKTMLNRKNRLFRNYKRHGYKEDDRLRLDAFRAECQIAVETAKVTYTRNLENKLNGTNISPKSYWKIINRVINKCRAPLVPSLLVNNIFVLNCSEKAKHFIDFFFKQYKLVVNRSVLPPLNVITVKRLDHITILDGEILPLIRNLKANKATGSDGISGHMLLLCDESVAVAQWLRVSNIFRQLC